MNRKFAIIISIATVLLIGLLIALSVFRSSLQSSEQVQEQTLVPTGVPSIDRGNSIPSISKEDLDTLTTIQSALPFDSDSLAIDYSAITNKVYVEKKNEEADAEFQKFLEDNNLSEVFKMNPELFVITRSKLAQFINREEQVIDFAPDDSLYEEPQNLSYEEQRRQNQASSFNTLVKNLMSFKVPEEKVQNKLVVNISNNGAISVSNPTPDQPVQISYANNTSNIPCGAGSDYGVADGYSKGVLTKIRVCRVKGFVVNSQISKQFNDLHTAAVAAGITFGGGSFRSMEGQISIYQSWCRRDGIVGSPPPYPKAPGQTIKCPGGGAPGYSNHQMGLAIDFTCDGALLPRKYEAAVKNRCFQWLLANASKYGLFEYGFGKTRDGSTGYEGWHWSVNGN